MPEFALVAPVFFLIIFGIFDFGHGIFDYIAIQTAANEAARAAVQGEPFIGANEPYKPQTTAEVISTAVSRGAGVTLSAPPSCPDGPPPSTPVTSAQVPPNHGYVYVTNPQAITPSGYTPPGSLPAGTKNAPGGEPNGSPAGCWKVTKASGNTPLQITVIYHFAPITPLIGDIIGNHITLVAYSVYETEY